jgi:hypothetical protein
LPTVDKGVACSHLASALFLQLATDHHDLPWLRTVGRQGSAGSRDQPRADYANKQHSGHPSKKHHGDPSVGYFAFFALVPFFSPSD